MKNLSRSTRALISRCLCQDRAELKEQVEYWAKQAPDAIMSAERIAQTQELYRKKLAENTLAIKEISEELAPGLRLYPDLFPEVADVFRDTTTTADQPGVPQ
jgi:hypothetical protein